MQIKNKDLLKALGRIGIVKTTSGPVVPAKADIIKAVGDKILKPLKKGQDCDDWDSRKYDLNDSLLMHKNYLTAKDLYQKVVMEATSRTPYRGMRLDLSSIDMEETHCKFLVIRRDAKYVVEILYPNANEMISVSITNESDVRNEYEVDLESDEYTVNFGHTILKSIDEMANEHPSVSKLLGGTMVGNLGSSLHTVDETYLQPSAVMTESVDWELCELKKLVEAVNEDEDAEAGLGGDDAGAMPTDSGNDEFSRDEFNQAADQMTNPMAGGSDVESDDAGDDEQVMRYSEYFIDNKGKNSPTNTKDGTYDNMAKILGKIASQTPEYRSAEEQTYGWAGYMGEDPKEVAKAFGKVYGFINSDEKLNSTADKYGVKIIDGEDAFPEEIWDQILEALTPLHGSSFDKESFDIKLSKILPDLFNANGSRKDTGRSMHTDLKLPTDQENQNMELPGESAAASSDMDTMFASNNAGFSELGSPSAEDEDRLGNGGADLGGMFPNI